MVTNQWRNSYTARKVSKSGVSSGPYFPVFSPNTGKYEPEKAPYYGVNLRIQSEYRKTWTRKNSVFGHYISVFSQDTGKYGPEKAPYLGTFHTVSIIVSLFLLGKKNVFPMLKYYQYKNHQNQQ